MSFPRFRVPLPPSSKVLNLQKFVLPNCYPLRGHVQRCFDQFYNGRDLFGFPPPGMMLEVAYFTEIRDESFGTFERENCDVAYLAWLTLLQQCQSDVDRNSKITWAAQSISMSFHLRANEMEKMSVVYQLKENEEAAVDMVGHSVLQRARELSSFQEPRNQTPQKLYGSTFTPCVFCIVGFTKPPPVDLRSFHGAW